MNPLARPGRDSRYFTPTPSWAQLSPKRRVSRIIQLFAGTALMSLLLFLAAFSARVVLTYPVPLDERITMIFSSAFCALLACAVARMFIWRPTAAPH